jgi:hypothetical protein
MVLEVEDLVSIDHLKEHLTLGLKESIHLIPNMMVQEVVQENQEKSLLYGSGWSNPK